MTLCSVPRAPGTDGWSGLVGILTDPSLDQKIAQQVIELTRTPAPELIAVGQTASGNFEKDVHSWNPSQPMWRRSPKE